MAEVIQRREAPLSVSPSKTLDRGPQTRRCAYRIVSFATRRMWRRSVSAFATVYAVAAASRNDQHEAR